jgi:peptide/nickel transport system substrate-binding protein
MARGYALAAALVVSLLAVWGAGGAEAQTPKRGGTVVVAWQGPEPPCLNAWLEACSGFDYSELLDLALENAFEPGPHAWRSALVSRPTLTTDPFTVTYRVRARARWSDGRPVTASDFVFSFQALRKYAGLPRDDPARTEIRRVEAVDSRTVRIVFRSRFSRWRSVVNFVPLPRHVLRGQDLTKAWRNRIDNRLTGNPIGNGPFLVHRWDKGRALVLVRNPKYRGPHTAYLDRLVFRFGLRDFAEALREGDADVVGGGSGGPSAALEFVERPARGIKVLSIPGAAWEHFDIRVGPGGHPALKSKLVRRALAFGIDREALVRQLFAKAAPSIRQLDSAVYLTNEREYEPSWSRYRHRPAEARRLLKQANCRLGADGIYVCAGERLSLRFVTTAGNPRREQTLQIVQGQLRRVGVEVQPLYAPPATFFGEIFQQRDFDVALFSWHKPLLGTVSAPYSCGDPDNWTGYCSRLVTGDLEQLERIVDPMRYAAVANRADRRLAQDVPVIPLFQPPLFTAVRGSIQGVVPNAFNDPTWNAENWWLDR